MDSWSCCGGNACYNGASLWILGVVVVAMHVDRPQCWFSPEVFARARVPTMNCP